VFDGFGGTAKPCPPQKTESRFLAASVLAQIPQQGFAFSDEREALLNSWDGPSRPSTASARFSFHPSPGRLAGHTSRQPSLSLRIHRQLRRPSSNRDEESVHHRWAVHRAGASRSADGA